MKREKFYVLVGVIAYIAILLVAYRDVLSLVFAYRGLRYVEPDPLTFWLHGLCAVLPCLFLPTRIVRPSVALVWSLYITVSIPSCFVPMLSFPAREELWLATSASISLCTVMMGLMYRFPLPQLRRSPSTPQIYYTVFIALFLSCMAIVVVDIGWSLRPPALADVYEARQAEMLSKHRGNILARYALPWQSKVLVPALFVVGLIRRNPLMLGVAFICQLAMYSTTGNKLFMITLIACAGLIWMARQNRRFAVILLLLVFGGTSLALYDYYEHGRYEALYMGVSRSVVTPGFLTGAYIDFFSRSPKMYLSHSILSPFIDNPYGMSPAYLIGYEYRSDSTISSNANLWADGYCNLGFLGLFIANLLAIWYFRVYDAITADVDKRLSVPMIWAGANALANMGIFTSLLTHGMGLTLALAWLCPDSLARFTRRRGRQSRSAPSTLTPRPLPSRGFIGPVSPGSRAPR